MYDQTQSSQSFGMGGTGTRSAMPSYGGSLDGGQADEASASRKLRVRIAGTALFTVGLAALSYSMVNDKNGGEVSTDGEHVINENVKNELPNDEKLPDDYLKTDINRDAINTVPGPPPVGSPHPTPLPHPTPPPVHDHSHVGPPPHHLHDFSSCGNFSTAFAHARAELGGPGEIFIYKGKPYTTTYKHEVEDDGHVVHVKEGLEVEIVISETPDRKIIASDTDNDGIADKWYVETNETRHEIIDSDGDGKLDSYIQADGQIVEVHLESGEVFVPEPTNDVVTMDGVEFLAYDNDSNGQFDKLIGEIDGKYLCYEDTNGDGNFDHAEILSYDLTTVESSWDISPMNINNGHIVLPEETDHIIGTNNDSDDSIDDGSEDALTSDADLAAIGDDPYRVDIEHEINSGDLNNHADMSAFGH